MPQGIQRTHRAAAAALNRFSTAAVRAVAENARSFRKPKTSREGHQTCAFSFFIALTCSAVFICFHAPATPLHSTARPLMQPKSRGEGRERGKAHSQRAGLMMRQDLCLLLPARAHAYDRLETKSTKAHAAKAPPIYDCWLHSMYRRYRVRQYFLTSCMTTGTGMT
jgi:hypothetical protein